MCYAPKRYCPVLVAQEGSALWGNTLTTALLHDQNRTIPYGLIAHRVRLVKLQQVTSFETRSAAAPLDLATTD